MSGNYVIIAGASIENLGAESMTCIAAQMAKKMIPGCNIVLASTDRRGISSKIKFEVKSYSFPTITRWGRKGLAGHVFRYKTGGIYNEKYEKILEQTRLIIDISGYSFTTKFSTGNMYSYLNRIYTAKRLGIPYYIFPQSFGPIDHMDWPDIFLIGILSRWLFRYPVCVCARESCGYELMRKYCGKNLKYKPDMVLLYSQEIAYQSLRKDAQNEEKNLYFAEKNVACVPNEKILNKTGNGKIYVEVLKKMISKLLRNGYKVWIVAHCKLDLPLCNILLDMFKEENIDFVDCTESGGRDFDKLLPHMDFLICSRYHAIVHSYRKGKGVLALGWESKYKELLEIMKQERFLVDCQKEIDGTAVMKKLALLERTYKEEQRKIKTELKHIRRLYGECI